MCVCVCVCVCGLLFLDSLQAFARYLAYKRDNNELLLFILKQLASDQMAYNRNRYGEEQEILEVSEDEFVEKVCQAVTCIICICTLCMRHMYMYICLHVHTHVREYSKSSLHTCVKYYSCTCILSTLYFLYIHVQYRSKKVNVPFLYYACSTFPKSPV